MRILFKVALVSSLSLTVCPGFRYFSVSGSSQNHPKPSFLPNQHPENDLRASVELYRYTPVLSGFQGARYYLRFTMPGRMYNYWFLYFRYLGSRPSQADKLLFFELWTGMRTIDSLWARFLWSPVKSKMPEIYQTFNQRYNPETNLQTLLQTFMTNEDGYLKFYLTFIGQDRENNFFPMPAGFTEQSLVRLCRQNGCVFQIPVLANKDNTHVFDIGPTINILPNQESNKYLKNFWRSVWIANHVITRNNWPIIVITAHHGQVPGHLTVQQALLLIINGIEDILGMASFSTLITIPSIYFDDNIPLFHGQLPDYFLEIRFNFWTSRHNPHPYQNELKVNLAWKEIT